MGYEIEKMLVLSTVHVPPALARVLDAAIEDRIIGGVLPFNMAMARDEGWLFMIPERDGWFVSELLASLPAGLSAPFTVAMNEGCQWLLFDRDGPEEPNLPTYDW